MPLNTISIAANIAPGEPPSRLAFRSSSETACGLRVVVVKTFWQNLRGKASRVRAADQSEHVKDDVMFEEYVCSLSSGDRILKFAERTT
jgi:hypothetical protein